MHDWPLALGKYFFLLIVLISISASGHEKSQKSLEKSIELIQPNLLGAELAGDYASGGNCEEPRDDAEHKWCHE